MSDQYTELYKTAKKLAIAEIEGDGKITPDIDKYTQKMGELATARVIVDLITELRYLKKGNRGPG